MSEALASRLDDATRGCLERAQPLAGEWAHRLATVEITFDLRGRAAGQFRPRVDGRLLIRYNLDIARLQAADFIATTVPHEVAHVVTWLNHGDTVRPHGPEWQAVMRRLGVEAPQRCHQFELAPGKVRRQRRWTYRCACREHLLSTTRHHRWLYEDQQYLCRACGEPLEWTGQDE